MHTVNLRICSGWSLCLVLLGCCLLQTVAHAQAPACRWRLDTALTNNGNLLRDVHFSDSRHGWAVGMNDLIFHTADGGQTWNRQNTGMDSIELKSVWFTDRLTGWVVGEWDLRSAAILHTRDGGQSWEVQRNIPGGNESMTFMDALRGWVLNTRGGRIYHTSNGGDDWLLQTLDDATSSAMLDIVFTDTLNGWIVGTNGLILHTSDGGDTWQTQTSNVTDALQSVSFVDARHGWTVGSFGAILRTTDGGDNWTRLDDPAGRAMLSCIYFVDTLRGWVFGQGGRIYFTSDGGETWTRQESQTQNGLGSSWFAGPNQGWAVGEGGTIVEFSCHPSCPDQNSLTISHNSPVCESQTLEFSATLDSALYDTGQTAYTWRGPSGFSAVGAAVMIPFATPDFSGRYEGEAVFSNCTPLPFEIAATVLPRPEAPDTIRAEQIEETYGVQVSWPAVDSVPCYDLQFGPSATWPEGSTWIYGIADTMTVLDSLNIGDYLIQVRSHCAGCDSASVVSEFGPETTFRVDSVVSRLRLVPQPNIRVYPNPSSGTLTIENAPIGASFTIADLTGRVWQSLTPKTQTTGRLTLEVTDLPPGMYLLRVEAQGRQQTLKFVRE